MRQRGELRPGHGVIVFAAVNASPIKVDRMRALGAEVVLEGDDFDAAKEAARAHAEKTGALFVEDGALAPIAEGAGTIALELTRMDDPIDAILVPLGDGARSEEHTSELQSRGHLVCR